MKILLIATNQHGRYMNHMEARPLPIGLAYVAGYLDPNRHSTKVLDLMFSDDYLADVEAAVKDFQPDMVGLSIRNLDNGSYLDPQWVLPITKGVTDLIRSSSQATIVCGGPAFSILPNEIFDYVEPDLGIVGDGGETFAELAARLEASEPYEDLPGLVYRKNGVITVTGQRSSSGFTKPPRLEDLDLTKYAEAGFGVGLITKLSGFTNPSPSSADLKSGEPKKEEEWRIIRPIEEVVAEAKDLEQRLGLRKFFFVASGFNDPLDHAKSFCQALIDAGLKLEWNTGLAPHSCDPELIGLMKQSGCSLVIVGDLVVDAHDPNVLRDRLEQMRQVCLMCEEGDLNYTIGQTFGAPGETRDTVEQKLAFLRSINPEVANLRVGIRMLLGMMCIVPFKSRRTVRLKGKYCIVGVGETVYSRGSGRTTGAMGAEAIRHAMDDAGLASDRVDGILSYHGGDSTPGTSIMYDLGIRPNFYMDCSGGGSSTEALVGLAMGAIETGMCDTVAIYRSMNGYSQIRIGGTGVRAAQPVSGADVMLRPYGLISAVQRFAFTFTRHMMEYGVTSSDLAHIKSAHSNHASNNPKAIMKQRVTVDDVLNSRWIIRPCAHLLDCCLETDNATSIIVTTTERAQDLRQKPIQILGVQGRGTKPGGDFHYQHGPITLAGHYIGPRIFEQAGITHDEVDVTGCYDAFTYTALLQFEDYGWCKKGEGKDYVTSGTINLGGKRPNNTSGGHLCEGYTHGMNMVIENVRQLRGTVDDYCPQANEGIHTYDYSEGHCRQVKDAETSMNMGWGTPAVGSALILRR